MSNESKKERKKAERSSKRSDRFSIPDTPENVARAVFGIKRKPVKGEKETQENK